MKRSEQLTSLKLSSYASVETEEPKQIRYGIELGEERIISMIDSFCCREDLIGVPIKPALELFDKFCEEENLPLINHMVLGRIITNHFGFLRKRARQGKKLTWIYMPKPKGDK